MTQIVNKVLDRLSKIKPELLRAEQLADKFKDIKPQLYYIKEEKTIYENNFNLNQ